MDERKRRGNEGEALTAQYLHDKQYQILETQFRTRYGELDLIARSPEGILCFVEVKARRNASFAAAREAVTPAKQRRLYAVAQQYLVWHNLAESLCRFDVAEVYFTGERPKINYIEQAF